MICLETLFSLSKPPFCCWTLSVKPSKPYTLTLETFYKNPWFALRAPKHNPKPLPRATKACLFKGPYKLDPTRAYFLGVFTRTYKKAGYSYNAEDPALSRKKRRGSVEGAASDQSFAIGCPRPWPYRGHDNESKVFL